MSERPHLDSAPMHLSPGMIRGIVLFVSAGVLLYLAGILWAGRAETLANMSRIGVPALVLFAGIAATSFLWCFVRWVLCLGILGYRLPVGFNLLVYLSGLALTTSPGKLGETFRSVILGGALVFQLLQHGATEQATVSIAVATRLVTLWMGVGVGVSSLFLVAGRR